MKGHCYLNPPKVFTETHLITSGEYIIRKTNSMRPEVDSEDFTCSQCRPFEKEKCKDCGYFHEVKND